MFIKIKHLSKQYSENKVLQDINLDIEEGEVISIVGPTGCGKTTLLNIISGIDKDYSGNIEFESKIKKGLVYQNPNDSLLLWKNVLDNILFGEKINKIKIIKLLKTINLHKHTKKYPYQLSGGMKQLVAITRAFIHGCNLLLLDEPFSSLDYLTKKELLNYFLLLLNKRKINTILVSHDLEDAIYLSNRVIILRGKPASIKKIVSINFRQLRSPKLLLTKQFEKYKKEIKKCLED